MVIIINLTSIFSSGEDKIFIGFEDGEIYDSYFDKSPNCAIGDSEYANGSSAIKMKIGYGETAYISFFVCGKGGTIKFKYIQPSSIADLVFYEKDGSKREKIDKSEEMISSNELQISPGKQNLIIEYKFKKDVGLCENSAITSTAVIDDLRLEGDLALCRNEDDLTLKPSKPDAEGPLNATIGDPVSFSDSINDDNIKYIFIWGDGSYNETDYLIKREKINESHIWREPGVYSLKIIAINDKNLQSIAQNKTITINRKTENINWPGEDLAFKIKNANFTDFYLEEGHYYLTLNIDSNTNNISIKPAPNSAPFDTVIDAGINGPYCIKLFRTSNISIEDILFTNGNTSVIMDQSKDIKIIRNKFTHFKNSSLKLIESSNFKINDNIISSNSKKCWGIYILNSNSTEIKDSEIKNNTFIIPEDSFSILLNNSCGNKIYLGAKVKLFKEKETECFLINDTGGKEYRCINNHQGDHQRFQVDLSETGTLEEFCNILLPDEGGQL